jgi:ABC-type uncharacterized transport system ATPase subunit
VTSATDEANTVIVSRFGRITIEWDGPTLARVLAARQIERMQRQNDKQFNQALALFERCLQSTVELTDPPLNLDTGTRRAQEILGVLLRTADQLWDRLKQAKQ